MHPLYPPGVTRLFRAGYGRFMDLRAWLIDAHTDLRSRLFSSVIAKVPATRWSEQADGGGSSITWLLFHLARHHDLALSTTIRNKPPLFSTHRGALAVQSAPIGVGLGEAEDREISAVLAADPLVDYVNDVFASSRTWMEQMSAMAFDSVPDTGQRLERHAGLDPSEFDWLYEMWTGHTVQWLVHWPILGHGQAHVGEAISVRNRMGLSPF